MHLALAGHGRRSRPCASDRRAGRQRRPWRTAAHRRRITAYHPIGGIVALIPAAQPGRRCRAPPSGSGRAERRHSSRTSSRTAGDGRLVGSAAQRRGRSGAAIARHLRRAHAGRRLGGGAEAQPEVTNGERGSSGIVLRLQVMPARSRTSWATLPVSSASKVRRSTRTMWLSVPPETRRNPSVGERRGQRRGVGHHLAGVVGELGPWRPRRRPPPWPRSRARAGRPAGPGRPRSRSSWPVLARHRMAPPRGPRSVLWVVKVTTSATPTGSGGRRRR